MLSGDAIGLEEALLEQIADHPIFSLRVRLKDRATPVHVRSQTVNSFEADTADINLRRVETL